MKEAETCMQDFVASIERDRLVIICSSAASKKLLRSLGAKFTLFGRGRCELPYKSKDELPRMLASLRDGGFAMQGGLSGWPPASVFEELRNAGNINGEFFEIVWRNPNEPIITRK
jgi:hypothetical protein